MNFQSEKEQLKIEAADRAIGGFDDGYCPPPREAIEDVAVWDGYAWTDAPTDEAIAMNKEFGNGNR